MQSEFLIKDERTANSIMRQIGDLSKNLEYSTKQEVSRERQQDLEHK